MTSPIFQTAARLLVPISLLFAAYIFFKGHQSPGGGFVAGLVASVAVIVQRFARGGQSVRSLMRFRERTLIAAGLTLALLPGIGALLLGQPFLTSAFGYLQLPGSEEHVEWATVLVFDLGVFLVVLGTVTGMINALSEELEPLPIPASHQPQSANDLTNP